MLSTIEPHDGSNIVRKRPGTEISQCQGRAHVAVPEIKNDHVCPRAFEGVNVTGVGAELLIEIYFQFGVRQVFE